MGLHESAVSLVENCYKYHSKKWVKFDWNLTVTLWYLFLLKFMENGKYSNHISSRFQCWSKSIECIFFGVVATCQMYCPSVQTFFRSYWQYVLSIYHAWNKPTGLEE